ncbi:MAG TPA: hypothetical protein VML75_11575 [Kofleriaceae bacterium]|nr:hypothetical protein [Kofleriaceae bacterium]
MIEPGDEGRPDDEESAEDEAELAPDGDGDEDDALGELPRNVRRKLEAFIPDLVRKTFTAGMGAVFTTEEGIRRLTKEMTLPKDVAGYLANTASTTKDEFLRIIAREVREFLQTVNLSEEIAKMLTTLSFEVKTEIRFIPNDSKYGGVEPDVKSRVRLKRAERAEEKRGRRGRLRRRRPEEPATESPDGEDGE